MAKFTLTDPPTKANLLAVEWMNACAELPKQGLLTEEAAHQYFEDLVVQPQLDWCKRNSIVVADTMIDEAEYTPHICKCCGKKFARLAEPPRAQLFFNNVSDWKAYEAYWHTVDDEPCESCT